MHSYNRIIDHYTLQHIQYEYFGAFSVARTISKSEKSKFRNNSYFEPFFQPYFEPFFCEGLRGVKNDNVEPQEGMIKKTSIIFFNFRYFKIFLIS